MSVSLSRAAFRWGGAGRGVSGSLSAASVQPLLQRQTDRFHGGEGQHVNRKCSEGVSVCHCAVRSVTSFRPTCCRRAFILAAVEPSGDTIRLYLLKILGKTCINNLQPFWRDHMPYLEAAQAGRRRSSLNVCKSVKFMSRTKVWRLSSAGIKSKQSISESTSCSFTQSHQIILHFWELSGVRFCWRG